MSMTIAVTAGAAFLVGIIVTPLLIRFAHFKKMYDEADHRKVHDGSIPAFGGVGIVVAFVAASGLGYALLASAGEVGRLLPWYHGSIVVGLLGMHVLGVVDDMVDIPALRKLVLQLAAAGVIVSGGIAIDQVSFPVLGISFSLGAWGLPLTVVWIVSIANAVNLTDGIDGFCGGLSLIAAAALAVLAFLGGSILTGVFATAFVGATAAFLVFNAPPARIFMGDGGSLFAGTFLATLAVMPRVPEGSVLLAAVPVVLLAVPIMDTVIALVRRTKRRLPVHQPDREHFHHLLLDATGGPRRALAVAYPLFVLVAVVVVLYAAEPGVPTAAALVAVPAAIAAFYTFLHWCLAGRGAAAASPAKTAPHADTLGGSLSDSPGSSSAGNPSAGNPSAGNSQVRPAPTPKNRRNVFSPLKASAADHSEPDGEPEADTHSEYSQEIRPRDRRGGADTRGGAV